MSVLGLNHVNIRTLDVAASAAFYVDLFGFEWRQGAPVMGNQPNWLYDANGQPIIHLRVLAAPSDSTGPIDHIAFECDDMAGIVARLDARGIHYATVEGLTPGLTQISLKDPHGVPLELNFAT